MNGILKYRDKKINKGFWIIFSLISAILILAAIGASDIGFFTLVGIAGIFLFFLYGCLLQVVFYDRIDQFKSFIDILLRSGILFAFIWIYFTGAHLDLHPYSLDVLLRRLVFFLNNKASDASQMILRYGFTLIVCVRSSIDISKIFGWNPSVPTNPSAVNMLPPPEENN